MAEKVDFNSPKAQGRYRFNSIEPRVLEAFLRIQWLSKTDDDVRGQSLIALTRPGMAQARRHLFQQQVSTLPPMERRKIARAYLLLEREAARIAEEAYRAQVFARVESDPALKSATQPLFHEFVVLNALRAPWALTNAGYGIPLSNETVSSETQTLALARMIELTSELNALTDQVFRAEVMERSSIEENLVAFTDECTLMPDRQNTADQGHLIQAIEPLDKGSLGGQNFAR